VSDLRDSLLALHRHPLQSTEGLAAERTEQNGQQTAAKKNSRTSLKR
jgi:hypothetical protein